MSMNNTTAHIIHSIEQIVNNSPERAHQSSGAILTDGDDPYRTICGALSAFKNDKYGILISDFNKS